MKKEIEPKFYCDRCGAEIEDYRDNSSVVVYWPDVSLLHDLFDLRDKRVRMDLCGVCKTMLVGFLRPRNLEKDVNDDVIVVRQFFEEHPVHSFTVAGIAEYLKRPETSVQNAVECLGDALEVRYQYRLKKVNK